MSHPTHFTGVSQALLCRSFALGLTALAVLVGCAQPYVRPKAPDTLTPRLYDRYAVMSDGYLLPLTAWRPLPSVPVRAVVLALHGLNDYRHAYADMGPYLATRGILTYAYDQRGFGETKAVGVWHGDARLSEDMRTMASLLRQAYPHLPLYALGESMGGGVLLDALNQGPSDLDGMILAAPAVWTRHTMPWFQRTLLWLAAHLFPAQTLTGEHFHIRIVPSDNTPMLRALFEDPLVIKATRVDVLYGTAVLMDKAYQAAPQLVMPALILYGQRDQIIPKQAMCALLDHLPSGPQRHWRMVYYPHGYHMLMRDLQRETVWADIAAWILNKDTPLPSGEEILTVAGSKAPFCTAQTVEAERSADPR